MIRLMHFIENCTLWNMEQKSFHCAVHKARSFFFFSWKTLLNKIRFEHYYRIGNEFSISAKEENPSAYCILSLYTVVSGVHPPPEKKILLYAPQINNGLHNIIIRITKLVNYPFYSSEQHAIKNHQYYLICRFFVRPDRQKQLNDIRSSIFCSFY